MTDAWCTSIRSTHCSWLLIAKRIRMIDIVFDLQFLRGWLSLSVDSSTSLRVLYIVLFRNYSTDMKSLEACLNQWRFNNFLLFILLPLTMLQIWVFSTSYTFVNIICARSMMPWASSIVTRVYWYSLWVSLEKRSTCPACCTCISFSFLIPTCLKHTTRIK